MTDKKYSAWERFHGAGSGSITDDELKECFNEAKAALPYIEGNRRWLGNIVAGECRRNLFQLRDYAKARNLKGNFDF